MEAQMWTLPSLPGNSTGLQILQFKSVFCGFDSTSYPNLKRLIFQNRWELSWQILIKLTCERRCYRVWGKTKPKWQKLHWAICAASALPELFQFQVNVGTVSFVWRKGLRPWENYCRIFSGSLLFLLSKPGWFLCGIGFHCKRTAQFTRSFPAVLHSPDIRLREALVTFIYPLLSLQTGICKLAFLWAERVSWPEIGSLGLPSGVLPPSRSRAACTQGRGSPAPEEQSPQLPGSEDRRSSPLCFEVP